MQWERRSGKGWRGGDPKAQGQCGCLEGDKRAKNSRRVVVEGAARSPEDEEGEGLFVGGQPPKEVPPVIVTCTWTDLEGLDL